MTFPYINVLGMSLALFI